MNKGKRKEVPKSTNPASVSTCIKGHASYSEFKTRDFLNILNYDGPEEAKIEAKQQLNIMLSFSNLNDTTKSFIRRLTTDNLQVLSDHNANIYWKEKENIGNLQLNTHEQFGLFNEPNSSNETRSRVSFLLLQKANT